MIEHTAKGGTVDITGMNANVDDSPCELIHDNQDPVGLEENGLAPEQIDTPKAIFHMADEGEPRGPISWLWTIVLGKDTPHDIFVDIDAKGPCDLLRDSGTAEPGIVALYLPNQLDEIGARSLGTGLASSFGGIEEAVFSSFESPMESQNG